MTESTKEFWEKAYQSNIGKLIGTCYRYTKNYPLSEDLAHDAFLKAIDKAGTFKGMGKFEAWLRRIVVNHTLQYLRDRKKEPQLVEVMPEYMLPSSNEENIHPIEFSTAELLALIDQLPEHHRLVFNLYVLDKFTHAQIGEALGISAGTSKSHLARARKKLQQLLCQRVEEKQHKKALALLFGFSIPPQKPLSLEPVQFGSSFLKPTLKWLVIPAISIVLIIVWMVNQQAPAIKKAALHTAEKNPVAIQTQAATIPPDSVIVKRNIKQKTMKPLDSLALMLVLSTGTVNTATAKDSISKADTAIVQPILHVVDAVQKENGTFRATTLYWSEKNQEVYFKGKVRVDFKEQHFYGNGSFTFLGKVLFLVVDGQPVGIGKTFRLAEEDYELVTLNSKEATEKYGDRGGSGAVEITHKQ